MNGLPPIRLEGIRTLDLLHGKQNVQRRVGPEYACEPEVFAAARVREGFPAFTWESRGFGYPMGSQLPRLWPPSALDGHVVVWPGPGTDTFVQAVRCEVRSARPDDRAGLAVNRDLGEALRVRAWSTTGRRILLMTSTSPLSPSVKRRGRTPWRITAASVMSGVRPIVGAARSAGVSHQRGRPTSARKGDARLLGVRGRWDAALWLSRKRAGPGRPLRPPSHRPRARARVPRALSRRRARPPAPGRAVRACSAGGQRVS